MAPERDVVVGLRAADPLELAHQVGGDQHGDAEHRADAADQTEHVVTPCGVQTVGRLVEQHELWVVHEGLGELHSLLHACRVATDGPVALFVETGVAQHPFCKHCGMPAFYVPRSQPDKVTVNARCLDGIDGPGLRPIRFFDGRHWEEAQRKRIAEGGHVSTPGWQGVETLRGILDRALA